MDGEGEALQAAILHENEKKLSLLLQAKTETEVAAPIDEEGTTLLHLAANTHNPRILGLLLEKGVSVNGRNGDGFTALHVAAMWGRQRSIAELLIRGADPEMCDDEEMTPLDYAESGGHTKCVDLLRWQQKESLEEENNPTFANTPHISSHWNKLSPSPPLAPSSDQVSDSTADQSIAETFVSMYHNITKAALPDLTEVTELSNLTDSPSLLDILTPEIAPPPPSFCYSPHHGCPDDYHSVQGHRKSSCIRRLDLKVCSGGCDRNEEVVEEKDGGEKEVRDEEQEMEEEEERDLTLNDSEDHSLLALDLNLNNRVADSPPSFYHSSSSEEEEEKEEDLFSTALEESSVTYPPPPPPTVSPSSSSSSVPFLAESLKKIRLRRERLRAQQSSPSSPQSSTIVSSSNGHIRATPPPSPASSLPFSSLHQKKKEKEANGLYLRQPLTERLILFSSSSSSPPPPGRSRQTGLLSPLTTHRSVDMDTSKPHPPSSQSYTNSSSNKPHPSPRKLHPSCSNSSSNKPHPPPTKLRPSLSSNDTTTTSKVENELKSHNKTCTQSDERTTPTMGGAKSTEEASPTHHTSLVADADFVIESRTEIPPELQKLTNDEVRRELLQRGEQPGPVTETTRSAYLIYLTKLQAGIQPVGNSGYKGYRYELALVLNGTSPIPDFTVLEHQVFQRFRSSRLPGSPLRSLSSLTSSAFPLPVSIAKTPPTSPRSKRDWSTKTHFNYLLLDPANLSSSSSTSSTLQQQEEKKEEKKKRESLEKFRQFIEAVFYVGKGKNARSLQHLKDARDSANLPRSKKSKKLSRIISVWKSGYGVVSLHVFHNTTAEEAFCREACMIDAIGLDILTNIQRGHVHGDMETWSLTKRRQFGVFLLHKAFLSYLLDPPPPVGPNEL